jgi:hypothetical protein
MKKSVNETRAEWLAEYQRRNNEVALDITDAKLVDAFIEAFQVSFYAMPFGAHGCPALYRALYWAYKAGKCKRGRISLGYGGQIGLPNWVYFYDFKTTNQ